jgi:hypothetical protein
MTVVFTLVGLSALIGFGLGTSFRWPTIAASSLGIAVLSSASLRIQGFDALPGVAVVVACLIAHQVAYLTAFLRPGRLSQEQAHKEPNRRGDHDIGREQHQHQRSPFATVD